jgi:phosphatidylglycerol---prolipoprotein diacylglyceryl transferase
MHPYIHVGNYTLYSFGLSSGLGIALSLLAFVKYFRAHSIAINWNLYAGILFPAGIIGARFGYCLFHPTTGFGLLEVTRLDNGGFSYLGGLFGVLSAGILVTLFLRCSLLPILDSLFCVSPSYAFGKIGCFLAGDGDYGSRTTAWWGISFPHGLIPTVNLVQPTMLFLAGWELLLFTAFWLTFMHKHCKSKKPGVAFGLYLTATGLGRYLIEYLNPQTSTLLSLSKPQWACMFLAIIGIAVTALSWTKQHAV